jgi:hypothetical protein
VSWSFTIDGVVQDFVLPAALVEEFLRMHAMYPQDMQLALELAVKAGFRTAVCTGFRTPSAYGGPETTGITVMGLTEPVGFNAHVLSNIMEGPDEPESG